MSKRYIPKLYRASVVSVLCLIPFASEGYAQSLDLLEEITVTARKRTETLQDVPLSLSVVTGQSLETRGISRVNDVISSIPNVSLSDSAGLSSGGNYVIRGISTDARNVGFESGISVYVDGMFTGRPSSFNQALLDIDRIEVLRGPQGTLFGKNTIAGALNITTVKPKDKLEAIFRGEVGNLDYWHVNATANLPISEVLSLRGSVMAKKRDGTVVNLDNGDRYNDQDTHGGRIQALFKPSENLEILLSADYTKDDNKPSYPEVTDSTDTGPYPSNAPGPRTVRLDVNPFEKRELWGVSLNVDWTIGTGGTLTSITGYRDSVSDYTMDNDNTSFDILSAQFNRDASHFTQELRYASPAGKFIDYVVGAYYFEQTSSQFNRGVFGADFLALFGIPTQLFTDAIGSVKTKSYAVFADAQIHLSDKFDILLGARYTHEKKNLAFTQQSQAPFALPTYPFFTDSFSDGAFSPMGGLSYKVNEDLNVYARVAKGFKSGGWNADYLGQPNPPYFDPSNNPKTIKFAPENVISYEAGLKWADASNRFMANLSAFYGDYKNLQVSQFLGVLGGGTVISNAGKAVIKGIEVDFTARPTTGLTLNGSLGYLKATFDEYANCSGPGINCDGNRLPNAPKLTASFGAEYSHPVFEWGMLTWRGDYSYHGDTYGTPANQARVKTTSYSLVDLSLSLAHVDNGWQMTAWVNNVFDKDYISGLMDDTLFNDLFGTQRTLVGYGMPRTYGLRGSVRF